MTAPAPSSAHATPSPTVALVGAGPDDPELVTLRAVALLADADLVVADHAVVELAHRFAPRAEVTAADAQGEVDLVDLATGRGAADGRTTVRLYHGDAWLHPAHTHDTARLDAAGVVHETVPGVIPEWAVLADAGIPVHHRPRAVTVTVGPNAELPPAVDRSRTLVSTVADLRAAAIHRAANGDPSMPAAAIVDRDHHGITGGTATDHGDGPAHCGTLGDLAHAAPQGPGVLVTGAVAADDLAAGAIPTDPSGTTTSGPDTESTATGATRIVANDAVAP